jgi:hypothetical protein
MTRLDGVFRFLGGMFLHPRKFIDIALHDDGSVELFFENRRVIFGMEGDKEYWVLVTKPYNDKVDGSGYLDDNLTSADIIARALK